MRNAERREGKVERPDGRGDRKGEKMRRTEAKIKRLAALRQGRDREAEGDSEIAKIT